MKRQSFSILSSVLMLAASTPGVGQIILSAPVRFDLASPGGGIQTSQALAVVDLNGDARPDVVVGIVGAVAVSMNAGNGTLAPANVYSIPGSIQAIVAADFDGDGHPDLAVLAGSITILINRGDGTFVASPNTYSFDYLPTSSMVAGDLDHDGRIDLALITVFDFGQVPALERLINNGSGTFTKQPRIALATGASFLALADLNRDGYPDLITGNANCRGCNRTVSVLLNGKNGNFVVTDYPLNLFVAAGDLTGDGTPEIIGNPGSNNPQISVMLNNGVGVFGTPSLFPAGLAQATNVVVSDLDGDGLGDILSWGTGDSSIGHLSVLRSLGSATFGAPADNAVAGPVICAAIAAADMDGDGRPDVVTVGTFQTSTYIYIFKNQSQPPILPFIIGTNHGGNLGTVSFSIFYGALQPTTTVKLVGTGSSTISGANLSISPTNAHLLLASFSLVGAAPGVYDLVLTNADGTTATRYAAFTVEPGTAPTLTVSLVGRNVMRGGQSQMYFLDIANEGDVDAGFARVWIEVPDYIKFAATTQVSSSSGQLDGKSYIAFDVQKVDAGSTLTIGVFLAVPDNPIYAHQSFQIQAWKENR
jgi:hypothetical protein